MVSRYVSNCLHYSHTDFSLDGSGRDRVTVKELRDNNYLSEEKIKKIKDTDMITVSDYEYVYSGTDCNK